MKIVPVADTTIKKECTVLLVLLIVKGAQKVNGVQLLPLKKNQFVPIASLDAMVSHTLVLKRKRPALNAAKEDFHYKLGHMEVNREANREANLA